MEKWCNTPVWVIIIQWLAVAVNIGGASVNWWLVVKRRRADQVRHRMVTAKGNTDSHGV